jgi:hypothetical protein
MKKNKHKKNDMELILDILEQLKMARGIVNNCSYEDFV